MAGALSFLIAAVARSEARADGTPFVASKAASWAWTSIVVGLTRKSKDQFEADPVQVGARAKSGSPRQWLWRGIQKVHEHRHGARQSCHRCDHRAERRDDQDQSTNLVTTLQKSELPISLLCIDSTWKSIAVKPVNGRQHEVDPKAEPSALEQERCT